MIEKTTTNICDYLREVSEIRKHWEFPHSKELWFRAESEDHRETRLQPGVYRPPQKVMPLKSVDKLLEMESSLYREFGRCYTQLSDVKLSEDQWGWDTYFLMQHHGAPTRILDWTDGALIALHFAVREKDVPAKTGSFIYVLEPYRLNEIIKNLPERRELKERWERYCENNKFEDEEDWEDLYLPPDEDDEREPLLALPKLPMLWDSPHLTRRVAAQRSRFMIFGSDPFWLSELAKDVDSRLLSISIPPDAIGTIKLELRDAGITESVVFPDPDGLGRELSQYWKTKHADHEP